MRSFRGLRAAICWLSLTFPGVTFAAVIWNYHVWFARGVGDSFERVDDRRFGCDDLIYLFVRSENPALDGLMLSTEWHNRTSGVRHQTGRTFRKTADGKAWWAWGGIEFTGGAGGPLERLTGFLDPVAGRENVIGQWQIDVRIEDLYQQQSDILVLC